jgi:hypothetical protein
VFGISERAGLQHRAASWDSLVPRRTTETILFAGRGRPARPRLARWRPGSTSRWPASATLLYLPPRDRPGGDRGGAEPEEEQRESKPVLRAKGLSRESARETAAAIMSNERTALDTLAAPRSWALKESRRPRLPREGGPVQAFAAGLRHRRRGGRPALPVLPRGRGLGEPSRWSWR